MPTSVPVFVNDRCLYVEPGTSVRVVVILADDSFADDLASGRAYVTDGRGIECDLETTVAAGMVLRVVRTARRPTSADA